MEPLLCWWAEGRTYSNSTACPDWECVGAIHLLVWEYQQQQRTPWCLLPRHRMSAVRTLNYDPCLESASCLFIIVWSQRSDKIHIQYRATFGVTEIFLTALCCHWLVESLIYQFIDCQKLNLTTVISLKKKIYRQNDKSNNKKLKFPHFGQSNFSLHTCLSRQCSLIV